MRTNRFTLAFAAFAVLLCVGCGDVGKGPAVARLTAPPKPAPPDPDDHSPPPTAQSVAALRMGVKPDAGQSTQQPAGQPPAQSGPNVATPTKVTATPSTVDEHPNPTTTVSSPTGPVTGIPGGRPVSPDVGPPNQNGPVPAGPGQATSAIPPGATATPAQVGVGAQGKNYGSGDAGLVTTPISAYFSAKEMIAFNIEIPRAMNTFKAFNNRLPSSQAEFDKEIIEPANIKLPELPAGKKYMYDPVKGELMVVAAATK